MWELSKTFRFEAAHTLERKIDGGPSRRIHGHSYRAEVTVRGEADPTTGMVVDLGALERALATPATGSTIACSTTWRVSARRPSRICRPGSGARRRDRAGPREGDRVPDSQGDACTYRAPESRR